VNESTRGAAASQTAVTFQEIGKSHAGQRLDNFLITRLKGVPKSRIYRIIRKGEVRVNKKRVKPDYKLQMMDKVRIPPIRTAERGETMPPTQALQDVLQKAILFEDEDMLVINKPAGIAVHAGTGVKTGLVEALRHMKPELDRLELVHRLDKGTSGCLLLARNASTLKSLSEQFKTSNVSKTYHALVDGQWPEDAMEISAALQRQPAQGGERFVNVSADGKSARTFFSILDSYSQASLLEARPVTGRTHQIRVHAQLAGHCVIGDDKYAESDRLKYFRQMGIRRLCLHARELTVVHPGTGKPVTFSADHDAHFDSAITLLRQEAG